MRAKRCLNYLFCGSRHCLESRTRLFARYRSSLINFFVHLTINFTLRLRYFIFSSTKCQPAVKEAVARIHLSLLMVGTFVLYVRWRYMGFAGIFTTRIASSFRISAPSAKFWSSAKIMTWRFMAFLPFRFLYPEKK